MVDGSAAVSETPRQQSPAQPDTPGMCVWRGRDVVFVDPLDTSAPYWWPAMIVPTDEIDATMGCTQLGADEYLVNSTVRGSELRTFDTSKRPYTEFAGNSSSFVKDKAIKGALSFLKTGHVHAKFQWRLWQTGSDTLHLPFSLPPADPPMLGGDSDNTLVKDPTPSSPADDGDDEAGVSASPQPSDHSGSTPAKSPVADDSDDAPKPETPASAEEHPARPRRARTAAGTPRRGRPPLALRQPKTGGRSKRLTSESADDAQSADPPHIRSVIRELEEVQEEYRIFRSLVRRAAKDLWLELGNDWPPNLGTSTRYGKRRKVV
ncbi:hypothetical protein LPJ63_000087 [Coemansia sp. RSA 2711]|nr:hypothetical protein LPJ63_000087 [Coemansia sp. RSA 2711]